MNSRRLRLLLSVLVAVPASISLLGVRAEAAVAEGRQTPIEKAASYRLGTTLHYGTWGSDVERLQVLLGVEPDGSFRLSTLRAVWRFERRRGLPVNGTISPHDWLLLCAEVHGRDGELVLREGDQGPAVSAVQQRLGLPATGRFDHDMAETVRAFQANHGLVADGEVGGVTHAALFGGTVLPPPPPSGPPRRHRLGRAWPAGRVSRPEVSGNTLPLGWRTAERLRLLGARAICVPTPRCGSAPSRGRSVQGRPTRVRRRAAAG